MPRTALQRWRSLTQVGFFALFVLAFALKLLLSKSYFPYHQQVTGKPWDELDEGLAILERVLADAPRKR